MKNTSKFQNVVIATIVGWLVLFVFLPNLMIIVTSFLTRDDTHFVKLVFTLDNYARLLDPLYFDVLLHSLNMALIATLACLLVMLPAMGLFYVSDLMGGAKNLLIGNVIKSQFLNIRDWPFGSATSITLTVIMGLMLLVYWRASRLLNKRVELE